MNKQESLFVEKRTRKQDTYKKSESKDGTLSVTIDKEIAIPFKRYCARHNLNCKKVANRFIAEKLAELEKTEFESMSKEELIEMVLSLRGKKDA